MILGRYEQPASACFDEINAAVEALAGNRIVCLNASATRLPPPGAIVYNFENVPGQIPNPAALWAGHEVWDFSARNAAQYAAKWVPVGYHESMTRFEPQAERDIDVVFCGCLNPRRVRVLDELRERGLHVVVVPSGSLYGAQRDDVISRSKLGLSMLYYEDGTFPALRVAHLVANGIPVLSERCSESWEFVPTVTYDGLVDRAVSMVRGADLAAVAKASLDAFRALPLVLP